jgi:hypothetical protein
VEFRNLHDVAELTDSGSLDKASLNRRMTDATDARPGTFRYSDSNLGGEVRTTSEGTSSIRPLAVATVFRPDGSSDTVGTVRYSVAGGEARIRPDTLTAPNYGVEGALLDEVGQQAQMEGVNRLRVWMPDGNKVAENQRLGHGFHSTGRDPGARGVDWEKPL